MSVSMTKTQKFTATIAVLDAAGQPALNFGTPVWGSDPTGLELKVAQDRMSAEVRSLGVEGTFAVKVNVDADPANPGVKIITSSLDVIVGAGTPHTAASIVITASDPVEQ